MISHDLFNELNKEQLIAVNELNSNLILSAGAGTGKTKVLTCRIINLLLNNLAKPDEILCLTFTNKACKEMQERILQTLSHDGKDITIKTIHGFGFNIINESLKTFEKSPTNYFIYDEEDQKEILTFILEKKKLSFSMDFRNFVEYCKQIRYLNNIFTSNLQQDFTEVFKIILNEDNTNNILIKKQFLDKKYLDIIIEYQEYLNCNSSLDFKDLIGMPITLLNKPKILEYWQNKYKYILIDEFQDTSIFEYTMLKNLFSTKNIMLCGDLFQTIYGWRGSDPEEILKDFIDKYHPVQIHLQQNYRSTKILLESSYHVLKNLFGENIINNSYAKNLISKSSIQGRKIKIKGCYGYQEEAEWILDRITELIPRISSPKDIAIISRNNNSCKLLIQQLEYKLTQYSNLNIKFTSIEDYKFFKRVEIKDINAVIKYLLNPFDNLSLKRILNNLTKGVGLNTIKEIESDKYKNLGITLSDFLSIDYLDPYSPLIEAYKYKDIVVFDVESTGTDVTKDYIIQISAAKINHGKIIERFNEYLKVPISVGSSEVIHHISNDYLAKYGKEPSVVLNEFLNFISNCYLAGHNILNYDLNILRSNLRKYSIVENVNNLAFDTLDMSRKFYPLLPNHKLEYMSRYFDFTTHSTHNAADDVEANCELLLKIITEKIIPLSKQREELIQPFKHKFKEIACRLTSIREKIYLNENITVHGLIADIVKLFELDTRYNSSNLGLSKIENLRKLYKIARDKINNIGIEGINDYLQFTALANNVDLISDTEPIIPVITVHQSKGLEFKFEFLTDVSVGKFPIFYSTKDAKVLEEEKRIFYVAITRAKEELFITYIREPSSFLTTIPKTLITAE